jgi:hypothetical protein
MDCRTSGQCWAVLRSGDPKGIRLRRDSSVDDVSHPNRAIAGSTAPASRRARLQNRRPPAAMGPRFRKGAEVALLDSLDPKSCADKKSRYVSSQVQALEHPLVNRLPAPLPTLYAPIRRHMALKENEPAGRLQDPHNAAKRIFHGRNRAQREGADDRIHAAVLQRNAFTREVKELDLNTRSVSLGLRETKHSHVRLKSVQKMHSRRVVIREVGAGTCADFEDGAPGQGDDLLPEQADRLWITQDVDNVRIDMGFVERHCRCHIIVFRAMVGKRSGAVIQQLLHNVM